ncbi:hypothetical protein [Reyranella sp.]|uniref:hypothetical protein n=1 Tax=Reyranella sp. TaxID=1929291 RepID=UPI003BA9D373
MTKVNVEGAVPGEASGLIERIRRQGRVGAAVGAALAESTHGAASTALAMPEKGGATGADVVMAKDSGQSSRGTLSREDRAALCLLFTDREQSDKEDALSDQRFWERLLHSGSFDSILEFFISVRSVPQDMQRGRPTEQFKERVAAVLGLPGLARAETWSGALLMALGSDLVVEVLSLARPTAKATYLLQRVLLCRHLGLHSEQPFRFGARSKGEDLHFDLNVGLNPVPDVRLFVEGLKLEPVAVSNGAEGVALTFQLPPSLDEVRAIFGSLAIGQPEAHVFPSIPFRMSRSTQPTRDSGGESADPGLLASLTLVRAGRFLQSKVNNIRVYLGAREVAPEGNPDGGAVWRLGRSHQVDGSRRIRVLTADGTPLWSGNWSDIPEHSAPKLHLEIERVRVTVAGLTVALQFDEEDAVEFVIDGEVSAGLAPASVLWSKGFARAFVFETPLALMDGLEHTVRVRLKAQDELREFQTAVRISPTTAEWAALLQTRDAISLVKALLRMGRGGVLDEILRTHGEAFSDDLLTDALLVRIVDESGEGLTAAVQDAFDALWLRMANRPRGLEHLARRIMTNLPKSAASEEWRIIAQLPQKEALADFAIFLHQISDAVPVRLASEVQTQLFRLGRHALANQAPRNLSPDDQASPEIERARLRDLRRLWDGEAAALAADMRARKIKSPDIQRALVDNFVQQGKYLEAAGVSTEAQGVSRLLSRSTVHRRMARDTFPMGWVQWAAPAFEGANDDAERTLSRLAGAQSPSIDGSISIFLTSAAIDTNWPHRYFNDVEPAPALAMAAPGETCGALPAITEWTLILHGGAPVSPESIKVILEARLQHEDLVLIHQCAERAEGPVIECGFMVRTKHLQFVSTMLPQDAASVLARNLRHRNLLVAREALPT